MDINLLELLVENIGPQAVYFFALAVLGIFLLGSIVTAMVELVKSSIAGYEWSRGWMYPFCAMICSVSMSALFVYGTHEVFDLKMFIILTISTIIGSTNIYKKLSESSGPLGSLFRQAESYAEDIELTDDLKAKITSALKEIIQEKADKEEKGVKPPEGE